VNFLRRLALQKKKTRWQLASRCCWNRARPWHASRLVSFVDGLRTYKHPGIWMLVYSCMFSVIAEGKLLITAVADSIFNWKYSSLQYHWCPTASSVNTGLWNSSIKYNNRKDGTSMSTRMVAGVVQMVSIICPSRMNRFHFNVLAVTCNC